MIKLSPQQDRALLDIQEWMNAPQGRPIFRLFGFAGTGKTTITKIIADEVLGGHGVVYCAYTGKAALVMRKNGCDGASTIHRLIYKVEENPISGEITFRLNTKDSALSSASLCVVDECSMVDEELAADLLSFNVPVLAIGDPGQLPPVKGAGYFVNAKPDVMLTEIHRQAAGNPIIQLATAAREGRRLEVGDYTGDGSQPVSTVMHRADLREKRVMASDQVLCGLNRSRVQFNAKIRAIRFPLHAKDVRRPAEGEKLVCLSNRHDKALLNGSLWTVLHELSGPSPTHDKQKKRKRGNPDILYAAVTSDDEPGREPLEVEVPRLFFEGKEEQMHPKERRKHDEMTYGYVLTTHKAQGSQWGNVVVFDESAAFREMKDRWRYTAITRAAERLTLVLP